MGNRSRIKITKKATLCQIYNMTKIQIELVLDEIIPIYQINCKEDLTFFLLTLVLFLK